MAGGRESGAVTDPFAPTGKGRNDVCGICTDNVSRTLLLQKCQVRNLGLAKFVKIVYGNAVCG